MSEGPNFEGCNASPRPQAAVPGPFKAHNSGAQVLLSISQGFGGMCRAHYA